MIVNGVNVQSKESMHQNFNFQEIFNGVKADPFEFQRFLEQQGGLVEKTLFLNNGKKVRASAIELLDNSENCSQIRPSFCKKEKDYYLVNNLKLLENYSAYYEACWGQDGNKVSSISCPSMQVFQEEMLTVLNTVNPGQRRRFTAEGVVELYWYYLLHLCYGIDPKQKESFDTLEKDMDKLCLPEYDTAKKIVVTKDIQIQFYDGSRPVYGNIELVSFYNDSDAPQHLIRDDGTVAAVMKPGQYSYLLRKGKEYISVLPSFIVCENALFQIDNRGQLKCSAVNGEGRIESKVRYPASFGHSNYHGTFIVDADGVLEDGNLLVKDMPEQKIVSVSVFGMDYCLLLENGAVRTYIVKIGWDNLIFVAVGLNSGIAIDESRTAILSNGERLTGFKAFSADTWQSHYICQGEHGTIKTDSGLKVPIDATAVAVCSGGYLIAGGKQVWLYPFEGEDPLATWDTGEVAALSADKNLFAYQRSEDGEIVMESFD